MYVRFSDKTESNYNIYNLHKEIIGKDFIPKKIFWLANIDLKMLQFDSSFLNNNEKLLIKNTITGISSNTEVASEFSVMLKLPSPAISNTGTSGRATFAPMAAGNPHPIVPRPVELKKVPGYIASKNNDAHI